MRRPATLPLVVVLSGSIVACADILGADFEGTRPKGDRSPPNANGSTEQQEGSAPTEGANRTGVSSGGSSTVSGTSGAAAAKKCAGKAQACSTLDDAALCTSHKGCGWSAQRCQGLGTNCATTDPNVCFIRRPKCDFDLDARQCYPRKEWCPSATNATSCADQDGCSWAGGCGGAEAACEALTLTECVKQRGCAVVDP